MATVLVTVIVVLGLVAYWREVLALILFSVLVLLVLGVLAVVEFLRPVVG